MAEDVGVADGVGVAVADGVRTASGVRDGVGVVEGVGDAGATVGVGVPGTGASGPPHATSAIAAAIPCKLVSLHGKLIW